MPANPPDLPYLIHPSVRATLVKAITALETLSPEMAMSHLLHWRAQALDYNEHRYRAMLSNIETMREEMTGTDGALSLPQLRILGTVSPDTLYPPASIDTMEVLPGFDKSAPMWDRREAAVSRVGIFIRHISTDTTDTGTNSG